jgi:hypothetical protein
LSFSTKGIGIKVSHPVSVFCWHFKMDYRIHLQYLK